MPKRFVFNLDEGLRQDAIAVAHDSGLSLAAVCRAALQGYVGQAQKRRLGHLVDAVLVSVAARLDGDGTNEQQGE